MRSELEKKCQLLSGRDADILCDILLTQRVSDDYFNRAIMTDALALRQKRRVYQLRAWLFQQMGAGTWCNEIQSIQDVVVQSTRTSTGGIEQRVALFMNDGYVLMSNLDNVQVQPGFESWLLHLFDDLIEQYGKLR